MTIYRRVTLSRVLQISALMMLIFVIICIVSLSLGSVRIGFVEVLGSLLNSFTGESHLSSQEELIIFSVRLPRIIFAAVVGASLSLGGVIFQAILRNPLADPYILGISGGSALGAIIGIVIGAVLFIWEFHFWLLWERWLLFFSVCCCRKCQRSSVG